MARRQNSRNTAMQMAMTSAFTAKVGKTPAEANADMLRRMHAAK